MPLSRKIYRSLDGDWWNTALYSTFREDFPLNCLMKLRDIIEKNACMLPHRRSPEGLLGLWPKKLSAHAFYELFTIRILQNKCFFKTNHN